MLEQKDSGWNYIDAQNAPLNRNKIEIGAKEVNARSILMLNKLCIRDVGDKHRQIGQKHRILVTNIRNERAIRKLKVFAQKVHF